MNLTQVLVGFSNSQAIHCRTRILTCCDCAVWFCWQPWPTSDMRRRVCCSMSELSLVRLLSSRTWAMMRVGKLQQNSTRSVFLFLFSQTEHRHHSFRVPAVYRHESRWHCSKDETLTHLYIYKPQLPFPPTCTYLHTCSLTLLPSFPVGNTDLCSVQFLSASVISSWPVGLFLTSRTPFCRRWARRRLPTSLQIPPVCWVTSCWPKLRKCFSSKPTQVLSFTIATGDGDGKKYKPLEWLWLQSESSERLFLYQL